MPTAAQPYNNYVDGRWVPSRTGRTFENRNPANTDDLLGVFQQSGAEDVSDAIAAAAKTGKIGDGKIWITDLHAVLRIRTGETGQAAVEG